MMKINKVIVGPLRTNCYIISINNECLVIDPGDNYELIKEEIGSKKVIGTIITHHHFDHIGAINHFDNIHDISNLKEGINTIGTFTFEVIYTPGHTNDSICIYFKDDNIMFVGDFLFKDGIGRTDLGGNEIDMHNSLIKISKYNKDITIFPGHGDKSKLGIEVNKWI